MSEAGYSYFADIAKLLGADFAPMLGKLVPLLIKSCMSQEGVNKEFEKKKQDDISLGSGSDEEEDDDNLKGINVRTAFLDEKTAALHAMGLFSISCPKAFLAHMENCIKTLELVWNYFSETVRFQVVQTYQEFVESLNLAYYNTECHPKPIQGLPPKVQLAPDAKKLYFDVVLPHYLHMIRTDEDREVVGKVLESISDLCNSVGAAVIDTQLPQILECLQLLLDRKADCLKQSSEDDEEEEEKDEDEDVDHDELVLGNLFDLLHDIAAACGESVIPLYKKPLESIMKYMKPSHAESDWVSAIGCIAELFKDLPSIIPEYGPRVLPLAIKYCNMGRNELGHNATYCVGILAECGKAVVTPHVNDMLQALKNAYEMCKSQETKDNALSSILRIIVSFPDKVPMEIVVPAVFTNIPLNGDIMENANVAKSLMLLSPDCIAPTAISHRLQGPDQVHGERAADLHQSHRR